MQDERRSAATNGISENGGNYTSQGWEETKETGSWAFTPSDIYIPDREFGLDPNAAGSSSTHVIQGMNAFPPNQANGNNPPADTPLFGYRETPTGAGPLPHIAKTETAHRLYTRHDQENPTDYGQYPVSMPAEGDLCHLNGHSIPPHMHRYRLDMHSGGSGSRTQSPFTVLRSHNPHVAEDAVKSVGKFYEHNDKN